MASLEKTRPRGVEVGVVGNVWERRLENADIGLRPNSGLIEYGGDLSQISEAGRRVAKGMQEIFVSDEWKLTSVIGDDRWFAVVFTNPSRPNVTRQPSDIAGLNSFLKSEVIREAVEAGIKAGSEASQDRLRESFKKYNRVPLPTKPINKLLKDTNLLAYNASARYNKLDLGERKRHFPFFPVGGIRFQAGVAYIAANLHTVEDRIRDVDDNIIMLQEGLNSRVKKLQGELSVKLSQANRSREKALGMQVPDPQNFLGTNQP